MAMIPRFKSLNGPRLRRSKKRQNSVPAESTVGSTRPVGQEPQNSEKMVKNSSNSHQSNVAHSKRGQHVLPHVQEANQTGAGNSPPGHSDKAVSAVHITPDTIGGCELHTDVDMTLEQERFKKFAASKSHPSLAGSDIGEGIPFSRLQEPKTGTSKNPRIMARIRALGSKFGGSTAGASTAQLSRAHNQASETTQDTKKDISTAMSDARRSQLTSADAKVTEQSMMESEEIKRLRQDLVYSQSQIAELERRCEAQSKDLESSNSFLSTADKSSDSDVIRALQRLNAEAQQNTTYMADCFAETFEFVNLTTSQVKEQLSAVQRASGHIGQDLITSLATKTREDTPMLLQVAFQAYLASVLCQTASSWAFESGQNAFINGIYQRLRRVEAQAISGRWRTLARVHIAHNWITHPESLVQAIITDICDILLIAGCTALRSDIISKITSKFEEKITLLVELATRLNKMFDEVISSDFEAFVVRPGEKFDGERMEKDTDDGQAENREASVLCTTHLGLIKRIPVGTLWERGKKRKMTVLKANVLLESFLNTEE